MGAEAQGALRTPYYLMDEAALRRNGELLQSVAQRCGCRILLAQKAFSMFSVYPLLRKYLAGSTASGARVFWRRNPCIFSRLSGG